jgi:hypothetical protein
MDKTSNPLRGTSQREQDIMRHLLRMPPEQHKATPKPVGKRAEAQQRRRETERSAQRAAAAGQRG